MNWTIRKKIFLIGVIIFMALAISAGNAYLTNKAIQNASADAVVQNEQLNLLKKLNTAHATLITSAMDAIIHKDKGELNQEKLKQINMSIEFFENNFKKLMKIANSGEEKRAVNHIQAIFPKLSKSIKSDLVKLIENHTFHIKKVRADFIEIEYMLFLYGHEIENHLAKLFAAVRREREEATNNSTLRFQQITIINKLMRFHANLVFAAKNAIKNKNKGSVDKTEMNLIQENIKFILSHLNSLHKIVDTPYTWDQKKAANDFQNTFLKLARLIQTDLIRLVKERANEEAFAQLEADIDKYRQQNEHDLITIFRFVRLEQSESVTLELLQNEKFTMINKIIRSHSRLILTVMKILLYKEKGSVDKAHLHLIDENIAFLTENLESLFNMAGTDEEDIAAERINDIFPELAYKIQVELMLLIIENTAKTRKIEKDFANIKNTLDEYGNQIKDMMENILASVYQKQQEAVKSLSRKISESTLIVLLTFFLTLIIILPIFFLISRSIIYPLQRLKQSSDRLARGDFDHKIDIRQNDELGSLARSFESMRNAICDKIGLLEEKQASLEKAEKKYRSIFENAVEGIFQIKADGQVISANPAFAQIMGYDSVASLLLSEANLTKQLCISNDTETCQFFEHLLDEKGMLTGLETRMYRKEKARIWTSISVRAVHDTDGQFLFYEGLIVDITERKEKEKSERKREIAEAANKEIMESIGYAKMIQRSLLPNPDNIKKFLPDSFFIWMPRDIVSGDFIFTDDVLPEQEEKDDPDSYPDDAGAGGFILAVIDCTGHGVPGAFMTMIASSGLTKIIRDEGCHDPALILKKLNVIVKTTLQQDTEYALSNDGLDAAICFVREKSDCWEKSGFCSLTFAGAKLPLIYIHNNEMTVIKGDRKSIGYKKSELSYDFTNHTIRIEKGMAFYMATDGYVDQLGEKNDRRFGKKRFKNLLKQISGESFEHQRNMLIDVFEKHKGENEMQDDVTVVGFRFR